MSYRWENANDWLEWSLEEDGGVTVDDLMNFIKAKLSFDEIEDYFQKDMVDDQYYDSNWDDESQSYIEPEEPEEIEEEDDIV